MFRKKTKSSTYAQIHYSTSFQMFDFANIRGNFVEKSKRSENPSAVGLFYENGLAEGGLAEIF